MRPFLLFASSRSGSHMLMDLLASMKDVLPYGDTGKIKDNYMLRVQHVAEVAAQRNSKFVCGISVKKEQFHMSYLDYVMNNFNIINLEREDKLSQAISCAANDQRAFCYKANTYEECDISSQPKSLPPELVMIYVRKMARLDEAFRSALQGKPHFNITYEALTGGKEIGSEPIYHAALCKAIGLPSQMMTTKYRKITTPCKVSNLAEITEAYNDSKC